MDRMVSAEIYDVLLRQQSMILNLINCRHNRSLGEQLLEISEAVVRNTYGFDLAGAPKVFPCPCTFQHGVPRGIRSRDPSGRDGKFSWLPLRIKQNYERG